MGIKAKIIRDDISVNLDEVPEDSELRQSIVFRDVMRNGRMQPRPFWKVGTIIQHPMCYRLVQMGIAVPADEGCAALAGMTTQQQAKAQHAAERLSKSIHPDDFEAYDAGVMTGYDPETGEWIPGPNYHLYEKAKAEAEEEDDE